MRYRTCPRCTAGGSATSGSRPCRTTPVPGCSAPARRRTRAWTEVPRGAPRRLRRSAEAVARAAEDRALAVRVAAQRREPPKMVPVEPAWREDLEPVDRIDALKQAFIEALKEAGIAPAKLDGNHAETGEAS